MKSMLFMIMVGVIALLLAFSIGSVTWAADSEEEMSVTLSVNDEPLEHVLQQLFADTPYIYNLLPTKKKDKITLTLKNVSFETALSLILAQADHTYLKTGNSYWTYSLDSEDDEDAHEGSQAKSDFRSEASKAEKHRMLYVTRFGEKKQIRLREFPYPGDERVLWESQKDESLLAYSLSPKQSRISAITSIKREWEYRLYLIALEGGQIEEITEKPKKTKIVIWKSESGISWLNDDGSVWDFDTSTRKHKVAKGARETDYSKNVLSFLEAGFAKEIKVLRNLAEQEALSVPLNRSDVSLAVLRGVGIAQTYPLVSEIPIPRAVAAVSPDGELIALTTGRDVIFVLDAQWGFVFDVIPMTQLVMGESVSPRNLRWSKDSKHLTFTETHYHPDKFYAPDLGAPPDPTNWTSLVRMYSIREGKAETVAVGKDAFLLE